MRRQSLLPICVLIATTACAPTGEITSPHAEEVASLSHGDASKPITEAEYVARGLAMAMKEPANRAFLRNAMRDSRWTDHKLDLHSFIATPQGERILSTAAAELGSNGAELAAVVGRLPAMDLYVPFRDHRLAWRGSADVSVAASFAPDASTLSVYTVEGDKQELRLADGIPASTLVIMHPAEPRGILDSPRPRDAGETIQSASESGVGTMSVPICTEEMDYCEPDPVIISPAPGIYIDQFYTGRGDGWWGSLEMMFKSHGWEGRADWLGGKYWYMDYSCSKGQAKKTYESGTHYTAQAVLLSSGISNVATVSCGYGQSPHGYYVRVWEDDGGLNGEDDDFGIRFFYPGSEPFGAVIGAELPYYSDGGSTGTGQLSAWMKLIYR